MNFELSDRHELKGTPPEILESMFLKVTDDVLPILWNMITGRTQRQPIQVAFDQYVDEPAFGLHLRFQVMQNVDSKTVKRMLKEQKLVDANLIRTTERTSFLGDLTNVIDAVRGQATERLEECVHFKTADKSRHMFQLVHFLVNDYVLSRIVCLIVPGEKEPVKPKAHTNGHSNNAKVVDIHDK